MKPVKRIVIIAAVLAIFIVAIAFIVGAMMNITASTKRHEASVSVTDDYGRTVVVPANPQRVVSLSPAVTEIIYALGAEELLVGRTDFCVYPPEAEAIPSIGGISNLNIEKILSLNPDLVISGSMVGKKVTDQMDAMGTPMVCVIEKPRFEALYDNITAIGHLVGKEHEADSLNKVLSCELLALSEADAIATRQPLKTHSSQLQLATTWWASVPVATSPRAVTPSSTTSSAWPVAATLPKASKAGATASKP